MQSARSEGHFLMNSCLKKEGITKTTGLEKEYDTEGYCGAAGVEGLGSTML